jgi:hypothetical protein
MRSFTGWFRGRMSGIFLSISTAILLSTASFAQNGAPKYDTSTETKIKGTIEDLKIPEKGHEKEIVHLTMKNGEETVDIYLCPKSFMDDMGISFSKGDEITFTGSKVKQGDADMMLAREIVKGQDTLVFRDDKGKPVWGWAH